MCNPFKRHGKNDLKHPCAGKFIFIHHSFRTVSYVLRVLADVTSVGVETLCPCSRDSSEAECSGHHQLQDAVIEWDYSHTDLFPRRVHPHMHPQFRSASHFSPTTSSFSSASGLPHTIVSASRISTMVEARCRAGDAAARFSREISRRDADEISLLTRSLDAVSLRVVERLKTDFRQVLRDVSASLIALNQRLEYHVDTALGGVRRAFVRWFASEFDNVRERGLTPLIAGSHETVACVEQTIKQLTFTPSSENVARKVWALRGLVLSRGHSLCSVVHETASAGQPETMHCGPV